MLALMSRHTTFRFCLDPTVQQQQMLTRHAGASRFAFNQCLRLVKTALTQTQNGADTHVPWSRFDLINAFNAWKKSEAAGRLFAVNGVGDVQALVTGLSWRNDVCQQVFEEAAADLGAGLRAWSDSRKGERSGKTVGFPAFKKKASALQSFRLRNRQHPNKQPSIRVGVPDRPRALMLPGIGEIGVHDDTRRLRRMVRTGRARILFATVSERGGRWWVSLNLEAADLHSGLQHHPRADNDDSGWVGVDRGLSTFLVAADADGIELARVADAPRALASGAKQQRRLAKSLSRKQKGSRNRRAARAKLRRHYHHIANVRRHSLHQISGRLVQTHDRLVIEDLNVAGMLTNHRLAKSISDAGWTEFARLLRYKQAWRGGEVMEANCWYPSTRLCANCGAVNRDITLADRVFLCSCGYSADRDTNAAVNLARWGQAHRTSTDPRTPKQLGRATKARRRDGSDQHTPCAGETGSRDAGTRVQTSPAV
jgi:putative transposase